MRNPFIEEHWARLCGKPAQESKKQNINISELRRSEWSARFEKLMRNRLVMGAVRYGKLHQKGKPKYDRVSSCISRLNKYKQTGNREFLVDVANLCLLEFEESHHPNAHFTSIDDGEHVSITN